MKKLMLIAFVSLLSVFMMPLGTAYATDGMGGGAADGSDGASYQAGSTFDVADTLTGEKYACEIVTINNGVWLIDCQSLSKGDVFSVRAYIGVSNTWVHEVSISRIVSGDHLEKLASRSEGLQAAVRGFSPLGQSNANLVLQYSSTTYGMAITRTQPQAAAKAQEAYNSCMGSFTHDRCIANYSSYQNAVNHWLARNLLISVGYKTVTTVPEPQVSDFFPTPIPPSTNPNPQPEPAWC